MSFEEFAGIIRKVKDYTNHIALHVLGEPLLHPDLGRFLAECQRHSLAVNLTTNGTLLAKQQNLLLASPAIRQVNISLHSAVEMKKDAVLSEYLEGIFEFIKGAKTARPIFISLRLWNLQGLTTSSAPQNDLVLRKIEAFFNLPLSLVDEITPGNGRPVAPNVFLSQNPRFIWPHAAPVSQSSGSGFCRGLRDHVAILVDGTVVPCCLDAEADINLGNIHELSLDEILTNSRATALYEGFSKRRVVEDLCRRCNYRQSFS